jgi:autotransporter-associated beta strand protein
MNNRKQLRLRTAVLRVCFGSLFGLLLAAGDDARGQTAYTSNTATGAWFTDRWNNSADGPDYTSAYTFNRNVSFTSGAYTFAGMGGGINVGNITVASGVTVTFTANTNTLQTAGLVRTIDVGENGVIDFSSQSFSTAAGVGFIKNGAGVLALAGNTYAGGFTLNAGTVIMRGVNAMGGGAANLLTLNGGVVASNATRSMDDTKYGGGIVIGGNVQFGELDSVVSIASSSANLSFANNVSLGGANRTFTLGNNGNQTFSGVISNSGSGGITFAANAGTDGRFEITNAANTFTGDITITGGEVRFTADGSLGDADNDIIIDGGRFATASSATYTLGAGRRIFVGDGAGTSISNPGSGTLTYNFAIADKVGETGSWAKQGGGVLELGGVSTYTGNTFINNGMVRLTAGNDRLPTGTVVNLGQAASANLGTLNLNGFNQQIAGLNSVAGTNAATNNNIVESTPAATLTLGGSGDHSFGDGSNANSGVIRGAISLVKSGAGTQTLGDTNTYTGTTDVTGGTLIVNGDQSAATGAVTVATGGTLGGIGTIGGATTVQSGGFLTGATNGTVGEINFASGLTTDTGSTWLIDLVQNVNGSSDLVDVTGILNLNSSTLSLITSGAYTVGNTYTIARYTSRAGTFSNLAEGAFVSGYQINYGANAITLTAVPEPGTLGLLGLALGGFVIRRLRRSRSEVVGKE